MDLRKAISKVWEDLDQTFGEGNTSISVPNNDNGEAFLVKIKLSVDQVYLKIEKTVVGSVVVHSLPPQHLSDTAEEKEMYYGEFRTILQFWWIIGAIIEFYQPLSLKVHND